MRKLLFSILLLVLPFIANAEKVQIAGIWYELYPASEEASVCAPDGTSKYSGDIIIPDSIEHENVYYRVKSVEANAFRMHYSLKSIELPNSVTTIGNEAFFGCYNLAQIKIGNSVNKIGSKAFESTAWMRNLPDGIVYLDYILLGYKGEKLSGKIEIKEGTRILQPNVFQDCIGITDVIIPNTVMTVGESAFEGCSNLANVVLSNLLTRIEARMFFGCSNLNNVVIPNAITSIGEYAFSNCANLTNIVIPNSVTSIEKSVFQNCMNLTSVTLSNLLTKIEDDTFNGCLNLNNVVIPNSVTSIGNFVFSYCANLTTITIPSSITTMGDGVFAYCANLTEIDFPNNVTTIGSGMFAGTGITTFVIPSTVTSIESGAFEHSKLKSVTIPTSVTSIGDGAFQGCSNLEDIEFPNSVVSVGAYVLRGTAWMAKQPDGLVYLNNFLIEYKGEQPPGDVVVKEGITQITPRLFYFRTDITSIEIPSSVECIGEYAFWECTGLTKVSFLGSSAIVKESAFGGCVNLKDIYITDLDAWCNMKFENENEYECPLLAHRLHLNGKELVELVIPNTVTKIGDGVFGNCISIAKVSIPNSVECIGDKAFTGCNKITTIELPNSVTSVGDYAFRDCTNLAYITIGNSITDIDRHCFDNTRWRVNYLSSDVYLDYILLEGSDTRVIKEGTRVIASQAFLGTYLREIEIPNSVKYIGESAFRSCYYLKKVVLPKSLTCVRDYTFMSCRELTNIVIPDSVMSIGTNAFAYCWQLKNVTLGKSLKFIEDGAYFECYPDNIYCYAEVMPSTEGNTFSSSTINFVGTTLHVPNKMIEDYKSTAPWNEFYDIVPLIEEELSIAPVFDFSVSIQSSNGVITIEGLETDTPVAVYATSGAEVANGVAEEDATLTLETNLQKGDIAIMKMGTKSVKVVMK